MGWTFPSPFSFRTDQGILLRLEEHAPRMVDMLLRQGNARLHARRLAIRLWAKDEVEGAMAASEPEEGGVGRLGARAAPIAAP